MKQTLIVLAAAGLLTAGCHTPPTQKAKLERGWIGGEYRYADRKLVPKGEHARVYVQQVYTGTPAEEAGVKPGDLLLDFNGHAIPTLKEFRHAVDTAQAGSHAILRVYR